MRAQTIMLAASLVIAGCASPSKTTTPLPAAEQQPTSSPPAAEAASASREISVNGREIREADAGKFTSWICRDYVQRENVVLEVGHFNHPKLEGLGFVLYDGGSSGEIASYERAGLLHRWDWGRNVNRDVYVYSFLMRPDGTGLYYDFSSATSMSDISDCGVSHSLVA